MRIATIIELLLQAATTAGVDVDPASPLERLWKYVALGLTSIILEEANPIFGGIAARNDRLDLVGVVIAVAVGTWIPTIGLYLVGRWRIDWVRARWPNRQQMLEGALAIVRRNPWRASLLVRFAYGLRIPVPIACGAGGVPLTLYTIASGISCWVWSAIFVLLGWKAGGAALELLGFATRREVRLGFVAIIVLVAALFYLRRRRIAERTTHVLSGEDIPMTTRVPRKEKGHGRTGYD